MFPAWLLIVLGKNKGKAKEESYDEINQETFSR